MGRSLTASYTCHHHPILCSWQTSPIYPSVFPIDPGVSFKTVTMLLQAASTNGLDLGFGMKPIAILALGLTLGYSEPLEAWSVPECGWCLWPCSGQCSSVCSQGYFSRDEGAAPELLCRCLVTFISGLVGWLRGMTSERKLAYVILDICP